MDKTEIEEALRDIEGVYEILEIDGGKFSGEFTSAARWVLSNTLRRAHGEIKTQVFGKLDDDGEPKGGAS